MNTYKQILVSFEGSFKLLRDDIARDRSCSFAVVVWDTVDDSEAHGNVVDTATISGSFRIVPGSPDGLEAFAICIIV